MAREILFKAKRTDNGEWMYGLLCQNIYEQTCIQPTNTESCCMIQEDTICQYTGLTDKNGNKIWENDVVQIDAYSYTECEGDVCGQIVYSDAYASFGLLLKDRFVTIYDLQGSYKTIYEVLGNVFDNPELLKEE